MSHKSSSAGVFLWTVLFLTGLLMVFLYLFGQRYDFSSGKILSTGVITLSSSPAGLFFLDGEYSAQTPFERMGNIPFGEHFGCIEKSEYVPYCFSFLVGETIIHREGVYLWPRVSKIALNDWGSTDDIQWDPKGRGILAYDKGAGLVWGANFSEYGRAVYEVPSSIIAPTGSGKDAGKISDALFDETFRFSTDFLDVLNDPFLLNKKNYTKENGQVFEVSSRKGETRRLVVSFDEKVEEVIPLKGRDLLLIITEGNIFAVRSSGESIQEISPRDPGSPVYYAPLRDELFWQSQEHIKSFWFSAGIEK